MSRSSVPPPTKKYLAFRDVEDEHRKEYDHDSTERVRCPDGSLKLPWDEAFRKPGTFGLGSDTHEVPADYPLVQVPFRETFATFEDFMFGWCGYEARDEKIGRYGYWEVVR